MIFLNPAVLFGLLAASIPVLIHLLNLRKLKRIDFSTLSFLKELQKNKIRKIKLKQWILLALRVLIILFLVTAFARPTIKGVAIGGTTSAAKTTAVFVLDNTYSMSVIDSKGSYLNQAKATIKKLLQQLQKGDEVALVLVGDNSNTEIKPTSNLASFEKQIDDVNISYSSGYLHNSIVKAAKILSESQNFNKEIYVLSDFQKGRLYSPGSLSDLSQLLNDKIRLYTFDYSGKKVFNLGIDNLQLETQIFEKDKPVDFNVTITNYSSDPANNVVVSLFVNGQRSAQQSVSLKPGESNIVSLESIVKETGYVNVVAEIEDDDILQDNKRYVNMYIPKEIPVIIFSDNQDDSKFVSLALNVNDGSGTLKITERNLNQLSSYDLTQYSVVIVIGSQNISNVNRLSSYVKNGGSLFLMPGSNSTLQNFKTLSEAIGLPSPSGFVGNDSKLTVPMSFEKIDFNHPVFKDIFQKKEKQNVESPEILTYFKINTQGKGKNIISLVDGSSFLGEYKIGNGKVFMMNTAPNLKWSNFPVKSLFAPLMNKSVYYLSSTDRTGSNFIAGNPLNINLRNQSLAQIKIVKPDKNDVFLNLENRRQTNFIDYNETNIAGEYKIYSGQKLIDELSVNTDPQESVTQYLKESDFKDYLKKINFKGKYINIAKDANPVEVVLQSRFGSELWKYFLLVALILALVEMAVARNAKRDLVNVS